MQAARRLLQSGEVEGGGSGLAAGCFPDFYSPQDFENWLNGVYQGMIHQQLCTIAPTKARGPDDHRLALVLLLQSCHPDSNSP